jgi:hypothetical protein
VNYELKPENPGLVYIFNNRIFLNDETRKEKFLYRNGSNRNVKKLENLFKGMNFTVEKFIDYNAFGTRQIIEEITTKTDYTNVDSLFVFIMSHGHKDEFGDHHILTYDEQYVKVEEFIEPFKTVDSLKEKPKFFFIEASRGKYNNPIIGHVEKKELKKLENEIPANVKKLGVDFLIAHSTCDNCVSIIDKINGSWFIHILCKMIKEHGNKLDITTLMSKVNNQMHQREYRGNDKKLYKTLSTYAYCLSKIFKFPKQLEVN